MVLKYEGVLDSLNEKLINTCTSFLNNQGIADGKVNVEVLGKSGDNYVAIVRRFIVQNGHTDKPFRMIVKIGSNNEAVRMIMQTTKAFQNESLMYNKVLPKYKQLEESADIHKRSRFRSPICYGAQLEAPQECIALEDMNELGFALADRLESLNDDEVKLILNDIAKFHALGFALKEFESSVFEEIKQELGNDGDVVGSFEPTKNYMKFLAIQIESVLDKDEDKKRVKEVFSSYSSSLKKLHKNDMNSKHAIVIQGDCWTNNCLFRREDGKPVEVVLLDYQGSRVTSPAVELHYFIFNCTDSETRKGRYYEWLDYYYDNFTNYLANFGLKANYVYPRDKLDADLKRYAKTMMVSVFLLSGMVVRGSEEVVDIKERDIDLSKIDPEKEMQKHAISNMKEETAKRFKDRMRGLVRDFVAYGYI